MALVIFEVEGPDGYIYEVEGDENTPEDEVLAFVEANMESLRTTEEEEEDKPSVARGLAGASTSAIAQGASALLESAQRKAEVAPPTGLFSGMGTFGQSAEERKVGESDLFQGAIDVTRDIGQLESGIMREARPEGFGAGVAYDASAALLQMLPSIGATMATRSPGLGLTMMGFPAYGTAYEEAIAAGKSPEEAAQAGVINVAMEVGPEKLFGVFDNLLGDKNVKDLLWTAAREAFSEVTTEELNAAYDVLTGQYVGDTGDLLARFGYSGLIGALLGGGMSAATIPGNRSRTEPSPSPAPTPAPAPAPQSEPPSSNWREPVQQQLELPEVEPVQTDFGFPPPPAPPPAEFEPVEREDYRSDYEALGSNNVWEKAYHAADALPEDVQPVWDEFQAQFERYRDQEDAMFEEFRARKYTENIEYEPAVRLPSGEYTAEELALYDQTAQEITDLGFATLEEQRKADEIVATREEERTPEAEEWAVMFRPENVKYARGSDRGGWSVTAFNPATGRVFAEYETDDGKVSYTWVIDEGKAEPHPIYKDPKTGKRTYQLRRKPTFSKTGFSRAFRKQVDKMAREGMRYGTPDVTFEQIEAARKSRARIFTGALPLEQVIREETRRIDELGATEWVPSEVSSPFVGEKPVGQMKVAVQRKSPEQLKQELETEIRGRQAATISLVEGRMEKPTSWRPFRLAADTTSKIETRIETSARNRILKGTALQERAYQVLPSGEIRILNIQPNEAMDGYDVIVESVGGKRVVDSPVVHTIPKQLSARPRKLLANMPGDTIAEKFEKAAETRRLAEYQAAEEARREADKLPRPNDEDVWRSRESDESEADARVGETDAAAQWLTKMAKREKGEKEAAKQARKAAKEAAKTATKESQKPQPATPEEKPAAPERPGEEVSAGETLQRNLLAALNRAEPSIEGQRSLTPEESDLLSGFEGARAKYKRALMDSLMPFFENDVGKAGLAARGKNLPKITEDIAQQLRNTPYIELDNGQWKWSEAGETALEEARRDAMGSLRLTNKGERQKARAEAIINALLKSDLPSSQINAFVKMYRAFLEAFNPDIPSTQEFGPNDQRRFAQRLAMSRMYKDTGMPKDPLQAAKLRGRNKRDYVTAVSAVASSFGMPTSMASSMLSSVMIQEYAKQKRISPREAENTLVELGFIPYADLTSASDVSPTDISRSEKLPAPRPIEGRPLLGKRDPLAEQLEELGVRSGGLLKETTERISALTEEQLSEANRERVAARKLEADLRGELKRVGNLSKESLDKLKRLEEAGRKSRSKEAVEREAAKKEIKELLRAEKAERDALRDELRQLVKADVARNREMIAKALAERSNTIREETALEEAAERQASLERVDSTEQIAQDILFEESVSDKIQAIRARADRTAKVSPKPTTTPQEAQLALEESVQLELGLPEPVQQLALTLAKDEKWRKDGDNTQPPRTPPAPENKEVLDLETSDPVAQSVYVESTVEASSKYPKLRRYLNVFTRYAGLNKKTRTVVDAEVRLRGAVNSAVSATRRQWALARPHLVKAGWNRNNRTWDRAINSYLEGAAPQFIEEEYGIALPEAALVHLDTWKNLRLQLAQAGIKPGAWGRESVRGSILGGRAYLHKLARQTKATADQLDERLPALAALARLAWDLPQTVEDVRKLTRGQIIALLNDQTHSIWNRWLGEARAESGGTAARNTLKFSYNGVEMNLGRGEGRKISSKGLDELLGNLKGDARTEARAAQLKQLQDVIIAGMPNEAAYRTAVRGMVDIYEDEKASALARGRGANRSIQQQRRLMLSHAEQIREAAARVRASLRKVEDKEAFDLFMKANDNAKAMTLGTFIKRVKQAFPESLDAIRRVEAEARLVESLRDAINEVTDTETLMGRTMEGIAATVFSSRYLQLISAVGMGQGWASIEQSEGKGWVRLSEENTALGDATFHVPGTDIFRKGSDIFVPTQVHTAVKDLFGIDAGDTTGIHWLRVLSAWVKYGKVVLVPLAHLRNLISTRFIHYRNNLVGYGAARARKYGAQLMGGQFVSAFGARAESWVEAKKSEEVLRIQKWAEDRNISYDGSHSGAIYDLFQYSVGAANLKTQARHKGMESLVRAKNFVDEAFRLEDESVKITGFLMAAAEILELQGHDQSLLDRAIAGEKLTPKERVLLEATLDKAAEMTLNLYPTFSRTSPFIKWLSRNPFFGAFPSFAFEIARTSVNALVYTADLAKASVTGKLYDGTVVSRPKAAMLASAKAAQQITMNSLGAIIGQTITAMAYDALFGDDEEDKEWYEYLPDWFRFATNGFRIGETPEQRQSQGLLQWWQRDTMAVISQVNPETGDYRTVQVDYALPTGAWDAALIRGYQDIQRALETGDSNIVSATADAVKMQLHNIFLNEEVLVGSFLARVGGPGDTYRHDRALKKAADWLQLAGMELFGGKSDMMNNILAPFAAASLENMPLAETIAQTIQAWEWVAEKASDEKDPDVAQLADTVVSIVGHLIGFKQRDVEFQHDWPRMFKADLRNLARQDNLMRKHLATGKFDNYDEFKAAFDVENTHRRQAFDVLFYSLSGAKQMLGRSRGEIYRALNDAHSDKTKAGLSIAMMERGKYLPPTPKTFIKTLRGWDEEKGEQAAKELAIPEAEIVQKRKWYIQAYREAGYELSNYE